MNLAHLHHMANQIARNFAVQGDEQAIAATAQHLRDFWDPRMRTAVLAGDKAGLSAIARAAVDLLAEANVVGADGLEPPTLSV
jgi:formate dehydrogenase subunit delta